MSISGLRKGGARSRAPHTGIDGFPTAARACSKRCQPVSGAELDPDAEHPRILTAVKEIEG